MSRPVLGVLVGGVLGAMDGLSAWLSPDARPMMLTIVMGSTVKGVVTGLLAGLIGTRTRSMVVGITVGLIIGLVLSSLVAIGQRDHYWEIVLPGMLVGAFVGFVTQRYPQGAAGTRAAGTIALMLAVSLWSVSLRAVGQSAPAADPLDPIAPLVGRWVGTTEGEPGKGTVERDYERVLGSRFVQVRNRSTYPPQEGSAKGEAHEDLGLFSFDSARKRIVFRQFHKEGFVIQYVMEPGSPAGRLVLTTEAIENIPPGWRARETYVISAPDRMEEIFELAEPGKDFAVYSRTRLTRARWLPPVEHAAGGAQPHPRTDVGRAARRVRGGGAARGHPRRARLPVRALARRSAVAVGGPAQDDRPRRELQRPAVRPRRTAKLTRGVAFPRHPPVARNLEPEETVSPP